MDPGALLAAASLSAVVAAAGTFAQPRDEDGRFVNLDGSGPKGLGDVLRWSVWDRLLGRRRSSPDRAPVPRVDPDLALLATPPAPGEPARLTWLGHASFLVQLDGVSLLIDPVLVDRVAGVIPRNVPPGVPLDRLPRVDASLVSHGHYDHLDLPTLKAVGATVYAGLGLRRSLRREGLTCVELGWWQSARVGGVEITFVPAQHWSRRGLGDTNRTLWGGFVVRGPSATIYHSGDTAWFDGFAEIGRRFGVDAALLPIGAYDPAWFMSPQHMNPEEALRAFQALGAGRFFAMHWGTFKLTDEPLDEPPQRLEAERVRLGLPADRVRVLAVGETVSLR
ncbi:MAG TPA: MBL fold metallo-hydrolase [Anaeromyxobacteraceae bacterium]|nr:MBL fold metallo-hydrolase [Anaeromyxobacteraceae bacterium]